MLKSSDDLRFIIWEVPIHFRRSGQDEIEVTVNVAFKTARTQDIIWTKSTQSSSMHKMNDFSVPLFFYFMFAISSCYRLLSFLNNQFSREKLASVFLHHYIIIAVTENKVPLFVIKENVTTLWFFFPGRFLLTWRLLECNENFRTFSLVSRGSSKLGF